tara:strand:+ start:751 stop:1443 length:693 start_codon:yes stop_codon:yes gene_type:complete
MSFLAYLIANFVALSVAAFASRVGGRRLMLALVVLGFAVGSLNIMIEAYAFGVTSLGQTVRAMASQLPVFLILGPAAAWLSDRFVSRDGQPLAPRITPLRLLGVMLAYMALYMAAGLLAYPFVQAFYADKVMPSFDRLLILQAVRALIFAAAALPLLRLSPRYGPVVIGLAFSVIGGIAPLLQDNPFMPPDIRFIHLIEVGISNFLFGVVVALLLRPAPAPKPAPVRSSG